MSALIAAAVLAATPTPAILSSVPGTTVQTEDPCKNAVPARKCHILQRIKDYSFTARNEKKDEINRVREMLNNAMDENKPEKPRFRSKCESEKLRHHIGDVKAGDAKCGGSFNRNDFMERVNDVLKKV